MIPPSPTILCEHIPHVVYLRADKQMVGIYASRIVAPMKDGHATRDRLPVRHLPGDSMCPVASLIPPKHAIATGARRACPNPTPINIGPINPHPKPLLNTAPRDTLLLVIDEIATRLTFHVSPTRPIPVGYACLPSAPAMANPVAVRPILGNGDVCGTIMFGHWKLHSDGPVGVCGTATGNSFEWNYSTAGAIGQFTATVPAINGGSS